MSSGGDLESDARAIGKVRWDEDQIKAQNGGLDGRAGARS